MSATAPPALRALAVVGLAWPNLVTGIWGVLAPRHWFDSFPIIGPALVAGEPPFNRHLAADAAAGFLATGVALLWAAVVGRRDLLRLAFVTYLAFSVPHAVYHVTHEAPALSSAAEVANALLLASGVVLAVALLWWTTRPSDAAALRRD